MSYYSFNLQFSKRDAMYDIKKAVENCFSTAFLIFSGEYP